MKITHETCPTCQSRKVHESIFYNEKLESGTERRQFACGCEIQYNGLNKVVGITSLCHQSPLVVQQRNADNLIKRKIRTKLNLVLRKSPDISEALRQFVVEFCRKLQEY